MIEVEEDLPPSSEVPNDSGVVGTSVSDALDTLAGAIPADELTADELAAIQGANAPAAANVFATMADVGGGASPLLYAQVADSAVLINDGTEGLFDVSAYTIPANSLAIGDVLEVVGVDDIIAPASTVTQRIRIMGLAGQPIHEFTTQATGGKYVLECTGVVRAIGAAGSIDWVTRPCPTVMGVAPSRVATVVDTTADIDIVMTGQHSVNDAGGACVSSMFNFKKFS